MQTTARVLLDITSAPGTQEALPTDFATGAPARTVEDVAPNLSRRAGTSLRPFEPPPRRAGELAPAWCRGVGGASGPIYVAIADALEHAIATGVLEEGERIPTHRLLARLLDVDLTTVTRAYSVAMRRGLLEARVGRGTFVRYGAASGRGERAVLDMTMNLPPPPDDPGLAEALRQSLGRLVARADLPALMSYRWGAGTVEDRDAGAHWLRPTLGAVDGECVLVCPGAQAAMAAIATSHARAGDAILAEDVTYPGIRALAAQLGLRLVPVETDAEGFVPDRLERAIVQHAPRLVYCNPTIQNPTSATMGEARRREVAGVLARHDVALLEDDAYGLFPSAPLPALSSMLSRRWFYVATTAKSLSPGLRICYVVASDPAEARRLCGALRATVLMQTGLLTSLVTGWIRSGEADRMLAAIRREAQARQRLARQILGPAGSAHPDGLHVWYRLPPSWSPTRFTEFVRDQGLALVAADAFAIGDGPVPRAVRIALGAARSREELGRALLRVEASTRMAPPSAYASVI